MKQVQEKINIYLSYIVPIHVVKFVNNRRSYFVDTKAFLSCPYILANDFNLFDHKIV